MFQNLIKPLPILCCIHIFCRCAKNGHSHVHQSLCQTDGSLPSKLNHCPIRFLHIHNGLHIFPSQWFKIQLICNIKICADRLWIVVDNNRLIAFLCKCPGTVNRTKIKFNALTDSNGARAKNQNLLPVMARLCLVHSIKTRIVIRRLCGKFRCTGIYHFIGSTDTRFVAHFLHLGFGNSCQLSNDLIWKLHTLRLTKQFFRQWSLFQSPLHINQLCQLVNKPTVNSGNHMNGLIGHSPAQSFCNDPYSPVIHLFQPLFQLLLIQILITIGKKTIHMLFQRPDGLHQRSLKTGADTHHFPCRLHLSSQGSFCMNKLVKRKPGHFYHTIIQHRLKTSACFLCHRIFNLI